MTRVLEWWEGWSDESVGVAGGVEWREGWSDESVGVTRVLE